MLMYYHYFRNMNESTVTLKDNTKLRKYEWLVHMPRAHLVFVHGYAEHAGRYDTFGKRLNDKNISLTAYDQRGFGQSDGLIAYIARFDHLINDLEEVLSTIHSDSPLFIMGHSMGGLVVTTYAIDKDTSKISGIISSSGALELDPNLSPILQKLAPILGFLFPKLKTEPLDKTYLTRSPENLENYMNDPLIYLKGTRARTGAEMLKKIKSTSTRFNEVKVPLLVLHGDADRLTMPGGSQKLYDQSHSEDKTLKLYPGLYHELVFEPEGKEVVNDVLSWIVKRS